jgi:hypothetical protein
MRELKDGGIPLIGHSVNSAGTAAQNTVVISDTDSSHAVVAVSFNNTTVDYDHADVTSIHFEGQDGFNFLESLTDIATYAKGGNDTLVVGNGLNLFFNVTGNDSVTVGSGMNIIV